MRLVADATAVRCPASGSPLRISLDVTIIFSDGDLVADRLEANGIRVDNDQPINWIVDHIYRLRDGRIAELWPAGGPDLTT